MDKTNKEFETVINRCRELFITKLKDYGAAWRILRNSSLTDQIFIKAKRIRSFEIKKVQKIDEDIKSEYIGIVNYAIIALIQSELGASETPEFEIEDAIELYDKHANICLELMKRKNHDYDEAWRNMRVSSFTDLILMKIFRTKQIEDNQGQTIVSEGVEANYMDMINYAVFALIKIDVK